MPTEPPRTETLEGLHGVACLFIQHAEEILRPPSEMVPGQACHNAETESCLLEVAVLHARSGPQKLWFTSSRVGVEPCAYGPPAMACGKPGARTP